ncbi:hypothetical protein LPB140_09750 [Sphingorhabdus lutea]|uniref:DUF4197 domain-containing protein n=1 Tax=Sphingorhabdus lutea TaxID=1913578 RepID=A0A1L3JD11_9SPHN|nr:DUF4197 domain-containing protein [Sphingorhabdus lutea]APG63024.1 hypothetical protein LPB140_09750 [Sphingorhabdus lutea]
MAGIIDLTKQNGASHIVNRRALLTSALGGAMLLTLPSCAGIGGFSLSEAIRRLLTLSAQNSFAILLQPGGFYDNEVSRISLPTKWGGSGVGAIVATILKSQSVRTRVERSLNDMAERGAARAAPIISDAINNMTIADAAALVRGGGDVATQMLRGQMGNSVIDVMLPEVTQAVEILQDDAIKNLLKNISGFDVAALARDISVKADASIWSAIGAQERAIRANPEKTNDALLIAIFGLQGK